MTSRTNLFRNRFIRAIIASALFLQVGIWVRNFAVLLFVMEKTNNNAVAVSMISVAEFAPIFLFSFIGGTYADRWRPKRTMVWCDFLSAVSVFLVLLTLVLGSWQAVFFATFVSAILSQFSQPSAMKLFKVHVAPEQLNQGMAIFQTLQSLFMIVGPVLGTYVYQTFGIQAAIAIMGVAFLLSAGVLTFLPPDKKDAQEKPNTTVRQEMAAGFRYVWDRRLLKSLGAVFAVCGFALGVISTLNVFIVVERLGLPKENLQWFMMANGAAMLVGGGLAMVISKKMAAQKMMALGLFIAAISISVIGFSTSFTLSLGAQVLNGLFLPTMFIGINTLILRGTEEAFVGRVNGILNPLFMGMMVIMMSMAGVLKGVFGLVAMYQVAALLFVVGVLILLPLFKIQLPDAEVKPQESVEAEVQPSS